MCSYFPASHIKVIYVVPGKPTFVVPVFNVDYIHITGHTVSHLTNKSTSQARNT